MDNISGRNKITDIFCISEVRVVFIRIRRKTYSLTASLDVMGCVERVH